jgi:hypothetical protein
MTIEQPEAPPAEEKTPEAVVKLQNNDRDRRTIMSARGQEVGLAPGETKSVRIARSHADWLIENAPELSVLAIRDVA